MIVSHKYKFIFIKTAKTAGTSIEVFLSSVCSNDDIFTPIFPEVEPHRPRNYEKYEFRNHMPASEIKKKLPDDIWNEYFKFCVERNPWDKTLSHYHMLNYRAGGDLTLQQYFEQEKFCRNFAMYTDSNENLIVDKVLSYENLMGDLEIVFKQLGIPFSGSLGVRAKSEYRSDRNHYRNVLTEQQAKRIRQLFNREINLLGYEF